MKIYWELFATFFRIGLFTFGGGYAMLPMLQREVVEKKKWVTEEDILNFFAIGQCTPGVIAVNTATFIGYRRKGVPGSILTTLGIVCPSLIIITAIAAFLQSFTELAWVNHAFAGIRVAVLTLMVQAITKLWKGSIPDIFCLICFLVILVLNLCLDLSPVLFVLLSALAGLCYQLIREGRKS